MACATSALVPNTAAFNATTAAGPFALQPIPSKTLDAALAGVFGALAAACLAAFTVLKRAFDRTKVRPLVVPRLATAGFMCFLVSDTITKAAGYDQVPCVVWTLAASFVVPLTGFAVIMRWCYFLLLARFAAASAAYGGNLTNNAAAEPVLTTWTESISWTARALLDAASIPFRRDPTNAIANANANAAAASASASATVAAVPSPSSPTPTNSLIKPTPLLGVDAAANAAVDPLQSLHTLKFALTQRGQTLLALFFVGPFLLAGLVAVLASDPAYAAGCTNCIVMSFAVIALLIVEGILIVVVAVSLSLRTSGMRDPFAFTAESRWCVLDAAIALVFFLIRIFAVYTEPGGFDSSAPVMFFLFMIVVHSTIYPLYVAYKTEGTGGMRREWRRAKKRVVNTLTRAKRRMLLVDASMEASVGPGGGNNNNNNNNNSGGPRRGGAFASGPGEAAAAGGNSPHVPRHGGLRQTASFASSSQHDNDAPAAAPPSPALPSTMSSQNLTSLIRAGLNVTGRNLDAVLVDTELRERFDKYVQSEFASETLAFLDAVATYRKSYFDVGPTARLARAKRIAQVYLEPGALQQVNVAAATVRKVKRALADATAHPTQSVSRDVFDEARMEIARILEDGPLTRFRRTKEFKDLVASRNLEMGEMDGVRMSTGGV